MPDRPIKMRDGQVAAVPDNWNDDQIAAFITAWDEDHPPRQTADQALARMGRSFDPSDPMSFDPARPNESERTAFRQHVLPAVVNAGLAYMTGGLSLPYQSAIQGGAGLGMGLGLQGQSPAEATQGGIIDALMPKGTDLALRGVVRAAKFVAPKLTKAGFDLAKSVMKVRDPVAKMSSASGGGTDVDKGVDAVVQSALDRGWTAPTTKNRVAGFTTKNQAGRTVEREWLTPRQRPAGAIDRPDRLLPSHATSFEDIPLGPPPVQGSTMVVSPQRLRLSGEGNANEAIRFTEGTGPGRPGGPSAARPGFPGDQVPAIQYLGEGGREGLAPQSLSGPGVLRREVPPRVVGGQPFDTVRRADVIRSIDADIAAATASAQPTTGLHALRARWEAMPEFIDRPTAREVVKGINARLAPRYHNALNDPVAVASEKQVGRVVRDEMMTPGMEAANADFAELKPLALALSHAKKRAGARELFGLGAMAKMAGGAAGGMLAGGPLGAFMGTAAGAVASHPVTQGHAAQGMYDLGKMLMKSKASDAVRQQIINALLQVRRQ